jgi:NAD(P)-dependent dehydrogenase (short-subunit alcohol dehydrogenase family)
LLKDKVAVISGASQGIGADIAKLFAEEGAAVILLARTASKLEQVADGIKKTGGKAYSFPMDVSLTDNWRKLSAWMYEQSLSCDILVNNAYWRTYEPIGEVTDESWELTIGVTLKSYFLASREMIPFMSEKRSGSIPEPRFGAYAVAKGGVDSLTRVIAKDYGPMIRANTIIAGAVDTPGFAEGEEFKKELGSKLPLGRIGYGTEIAQTALFLGSPMSQFITGTQIVADGGRSIT